MVYRFLLKYVSRDEVALFDRGTGGVPDVRNAIDAFEENSPLYGFLQYRRRKVVLSYLPDDASRLVKGAPSLLRSDPRCIPLTMVLDFLQPGPRFNSNRSWTDSRPTMRSFPFQARPDSVKARCRPLASSTPPRTP